MGTTFLVQNNYYSSQIQRTGAQDNARVATEVVARAVRSAMESGIVVAGARTLVVRSPIVLGVVCARPSSSEADIHTEGGPAGLDSAEVAGLAVRNSVVGSWAYGLATWGVLNRADGSSSANCAANGADTTGARGEFHRVGALDALPIPTPGTGDVVMLFRETTFKIDTSQLDSARLGLFRGSVGGPLVEFATGMDPTAQFQYRVGGVYVDTVGASVGAVDAVRIVAEARKPAQTGGREDVTFGWAVNIALRNTR